MRGDFIPPQGVLRTGQSVCVSVCSQDEGGSEYASSFGTSRSSMGRRARRKRARRRVITGRGQFTHLQCVGNDPPNNTAPERKSKKLSYEGLPVTTIPPDQFFRTYLPLSGCIHDDVEYIMEEEDWCMVAPDCDQIYRHLSCFDHAEYSIPEPNRSELVY